MNYRAWQQERDLTSSHATGQSRRRVLAEGKVARREWWNLSETCSMSQRGVRLGHSAIPAQYPLPESGHQRRQFACPLSADCVAKLFCPSERARLIQDQASMRNVDSRIHSPRFDCCVFLFYSFSAVTFATQSAHNGRSTMSAPTSARGGKAEMLRTAPIRRS
jgi:hypothetical protein